jgi:hypothetical protein
VDILRWRSDLHKHCTMASFIQMDLTVHFEASVSPNFM